MPTHTAKSKHDRTKAVPVRQKKTKKFLKQYTRSSCSRKLIQDSMAQSDDIITETSNKRFKPPWAFRGCTAEREKEKRQRHHTRAPEPKVAVEEPKERTAAVEKEARDRMIKAVAWVRADQSVSLYMRPSSPPRSKADRDYLVRYVQRAIVACEEDERLRTLRHRGIMRCAPMLMLWRKRATESVYHPGNIDFARIMSED